MKDNFSKQALRYSQYRPQYPNELFDFLTNTVSPKNLAWDCGTGNGQTAREIGKYFKEVYATDISEKQLTHASKAGNILYCVEPAEKTALKDKSVNLITISQALHWFNLPAFYKEVKRVGAPGAVIAAWAYGLLTITPAIDKIIKHYHFETLKDYWDEERKFVDDAYTNIPFPFNGIPHPQFYIKANWIIKDLEGYLSTWSALQKFIGVKNYNPLADLLQEIKPYWPESVFLPVVFPIHLKLGYVP
ncbi:MAG: class I SAM-dependent methyltransferase [Ferruginibacter sp.]